MSDTDSEVHDNVDRPDVRQYMAELLAGGEPSLDEVDWGRFRHSYGAAGDVPDLIRALSARDQQRASASLSTLWNKVRHQGQAAGAAAALTSLLARPGEDQHAIATALGRIGPAATIAVPVLDELLASAPTKLAGVLAWARWRITGERTAQTAETLARLAGTPPHGPEGLRLLGDLGPAAAAYAPMIRARLTHSYEWARAEAARALWRCTGDTAGTVPVLVRLLDGYPWLPMFAPVHAVQPDGADLSARGGFVGGGGNSADVDRLLHWRPWGSSVTGLDGVVRA